MGELILKSIQASFTVKGREEGRSGGRGRNQVGIQRFPGKRAIFLYPFVPGGPLLINLSLVLESLLRAYFPTSSADKGVPQAEFL